MILSRPPHHGKERDEEHLFLNPVVYEEIEVREIYNRQSKSNDCHGLVAPFAQSECEVGKGTSGNNTGEYIPVQVYEVYLVKTENICCIAVFKDVFSGYECENTRYIPVARITFLFSLPE